MNMNQPARRGGPPRGTRDNRTQRPQRRESQDDRWYYQQNGVKILQLSQDDNMVNATLLRYTTSDAMFSTSTVWKLPFRLKNLRAFLMHPYLSDEEKDALLDRLSGISTEQYKFEHLIAYRLAAICKVLSGTNDQIQNYTRRNGPEFNVGWKLFSHTSENHNPFIREVLIKNQIKPTH